MAKPKPLLEVKMAIASKGDRRKSIRRQSGRRKGDIEKIKIEGERGKEQEVTVRNEAVPQKKPAQYGAGMKNLQQNGARLL
jgi:hypothetical protein